MHNLSKLEINNAFARNSNSISESSKRAALRREYRKTPRSRSFEERRDCSRQIRPYFFILPDDDDCARDAAWHAD
jgi:hypothetical protein